VTEAISAEFIELFAALLRQGPGSAAATRAALELCPGLPRSPRIIDAGCGSGSSVVVLADALPSASIVAVDILDVLLDRLRATVVDSGLADRVEVRRQSMDALAEPPESIDLIWCEGAIFAVGIERALRTWRPLLGPGGHVVFSELCWWVPASERPAELVDFFASAYPQMSDEASVVALIESLGFMTVATRRLEAEAWLTDYYEPLARRCDALRGTRNSILEQVIADAEAEIASFRANRGHYGYTFFVAQRRA
jgi:SAM-dependent methyltransferase